MNFKIKPKYHNQVVGFNGKSLPLYGRDDLHVLAEIGLMSNCESILDYFENPPTFEDLRKLKIERLLQKYEKKEQPKP